jgi:hypothetical protein
MDLDSFGKSLAWIIGVGMAMAIALGALIYLHIRKRQNDGLEENSSAGISSKEEYAEPVLEESEESSGSEDAGEPFKKPMVYREEQFSRGLDYTLQEVVEFERGVQEYFKARLAEGGRERKEGSADSVMDDLCKMCYENLEGKMEAGEVGRRMGEQVRMYADLDRFCASAFGKSPVVFECSSFKRIYDRIMSRTEPDTKSELFGRIVQMRRDSERRTPKQKLYEVYTREMIGGLEAILSLVETERPEKICGEDKDLEEWVRYLEGLGDKSEAIERLEEERVIKEIKMKKMKVLGKRREMVLVEVVCRYVLLHKDVLGMIAKELAMESKGGRAKWMDMCSAELEGRARGKDAPGAGALPLKNKALLALVWMRAKEIVFSLAVDASLQRIQIQGDRKTAVCSDGEAYIYSPFVDGYDFESTEEITLRVKSEYLEPSVFPDESEKISGLIEAAVRDDIFDYLGIVFSLAQCASLRFYDRKCKSVNPLVQARHFPKSFRSILWDITRGVSQSGSAFLLQKCSEELVIRNVPLKKTQGDGDTSLRGLVSGIDVMRERGRMGSRLFGSVTSLAICDRMVGCGDSAETEEIGLLISLFESTVTLRLDGTNFAYLECRRGSAKRKEVVDLFLQREPVLDRMLSRLFPGMLPRLKEIVFESVLLHKEELIRIMDLGFREVEGSLPESAEESAYVRWIESGGGKIKFSLPPDGL